MYRDAGNNKLYKKAKIENPQNLTLSEFENWFKNQLIDGVWFVPCDFGLIKPQFSLYDSELDHDWCEFILLKEEDV